MDALCRFVCLTFVGRWDRVFFMGYYTGNRAGSNFSPNCSRCVHGRVGIAGWNESMVGSRSESGFGRGSENSGDTLNYTEIVASGIQDSCEIYHTLRVPRGGEYTLVLADGTTVYLNAESELRFPKQFKGKSRKVYLEGEGYFDVQRDEKQPFVVEVKQVEVRVLGTSFGIRAYTGEVNVLTTLVRGRVNVEAGGKQVELSPGQQADFNRGNDRLTVTEVDVEQYVSWKDGRLVFDNKPLEFILEELGRWYSFDVFYTNKELKGIPYSLNIKKHEDIAHVLKFIERTGKVKFEINKNTIIVK